MFSRFLIFIFMSIPAFADVIPDWAKKGKLSDAKYFYVVCSHSGIDPQEARTLAEDKCLSQAAKLGGVEVTINQKTVQGLTGVDASEVSEITPLVKQIKCEWLDHYLETVESGFRIWLRCRVNKSEIKSIAVSKESLPESTKIAPLKYQRAYLTLTSVPTPEKIIIHGISGERVIDTNKNIMSVELKEGDHSITIKKHRFKDKTVKLDKWKHGDSLTMTVYLEQEI